MSTETIAKEQPQSNPDELLEQRCMACGKLVAKYNLTTAPYALEVKCGKCANHVYRGNVITLNLDEFRCSNIDPKRSRKAGEDIICNRLLAKVLNGTEVEIKCPRCNSMQNSTNKD